MHWLALFSERNKYNQKISKIKYEKSKTETIISIVVNIIIAVITTFLLHFMTDTLSSLYVNIYLSIYPIYLSVDSSICKIAPEIENFRKVESAE